MSESGHKAHRAFISLELSDDFKVLLKHEVAGLKATIPENSLRWIDPDNWHLTLAFLGNQSAAQLASLWQDVTHDLMGTVRLELESDGFSRFPDAKSPIIALCIKPNDALISLQQIVVAACVRHDIQLDSRAFKPHVTLARVKKGARINKGTGVVPHKKCGLQVSCWSRVALMTSELTPNGSIYSEFSSFDLVGG